MKPLKLYLKERAIRGLALAKDVGTDVNTVSRWCVGAMYPRKPQLERLSAVLGRPVHIVSGKGVFVDDGAPAVAREDEAA